MTSICPFLISPCRNRFSLLFLGLFFLALPAYAAAPFYYQKLETADWKEKRIFEDLQSRFNVEPPNFERALFDLNGDGVNEYFLKTTLQNSLQSHFIYALRHGKPIFLGRIEAHKIHPIDQKTYGVHDILVYNIPNNDFKAVTYRWNPYKFQYVASD